MKKILYYLIFICVFFIGSNFVSAIDATCVYSPKFDASVKIKFIVENNNLSVYYNDKGFNKKGEYDAGTIWQFKAEKDFLEALKNNTCPTLSLYDNENNVFTIYVNSQFNVMENIESKFEANVQENKVLAECSYDYETYYSKQKIKIKFQKMSNSWYRYCIDDSCQDINAGNGITITYKSGQKATVYISDNESAKKLFNFDNASQCPNDIYLNVNGDASNHNYYISNIKDKDPGYYEPAGPGNNTFEEEEKEEEPVKNYSPAECGIFTANFVNTLRDIFDLIKIAGPILALALGTLDFVKAITGGDADKELKSAFARFVKRIAAAIVLFLLPIILGFLLDTFLKNTGYDPNNPYCGIVEWDE